MDRRDFLRIVYEQHPDKSRIEEGKRVVDAIDTENGISVKLDDGTVEEGDILIGCDGVHSTVRELLWRNANASIPDLITAKEKTCKSDSPICEFETVRKSHAGFHQGSNSRHSTRNNIQGAGWGRKAYSRNDHK